MRVLVTGAGGMLGREIVKTFLSRHSVFAFPKSELDITSESEVKSAMRAVKPDAVIHCAALTDVDMCEVAPDIAFKVNALGTLNVATWTPRSALLVYISTDYVFDGKKKTFYRETDKPNPINVYGKTKLEGERYAKKRCKRLYIVRTSVLYGRGSKDHFVRAMLEQANRTQILKVIADHRGAPTLTSDLAEQILKIIEKKIPFGAYHITNEGACTRYEFAKAILHERSIRSVQLKKTTLAEFKRPAPRPRNSALSNARLTKRGVPPLRNWLSALKFYLHNDI